MNSLGLVATSAAALLAYAFAAWPGTGTSAAAERALAIGWLLHAAAIVADVSGLGSPSPGARFGFAPALSTTTWLVLAVYAIESRFVPLPHVRRWLALLGIAAVALAVAFPGQLRPRAVSPWAPVHWVLGLAACGLFGAAVLHAALLARAERQMRLQPPRAPTEAPLGVPLLRLERLTFQFVVAGFATLSLALLIGWWFTTIWRWDHKTVFSVLSWFVFAGLLIGRRAFGWRGRHAARWLYSGAALLLLAYVGSRFVLEVVLHRVPVN